MRLPHGFLELAFDLSKVAVRGFLKGYREKRRELAASAPQPVTRDPNFKANFAAICRDAGIKPALLTDRICLMSVNHLGHLYEVMATSGGMVSGTCLRVFKYDTPRLRDFVAYINGRDPMLHAFLPPADGGGYSIVASARVPLDANNLVEETGDMARLLAMLDDQSEEAGL